MTIEDQIRRESAEVPIVAESVEVPIAAESVEALIEENRHSTSARQARAEMRPSPVLRSSFEIRAVHMKPTLNPDERDIYYYIVETEGTNDDTCAYTNGFVWASKGVFSSLKPHTEINIGVIDRSHNVNNINLDRCCQILFSNIFSHVIQVFFPVFTCGYYYLVVFWMKINKIEIIDSVKPPKDKDPLEKYNLDVGILILRERYCEAMLTSASNKKYMDIVRVADDWMTANKHRLPELQNKFKEWFSCRSKK
ncbi:hypothetical protein SASPL_135339 [Salvia splendens]|uniref:Uncharacterized protein n=1 Tax=Salvia splendens TaxID=180675 RepID=A0A8X8ZFD2_SALSN|nr:hypothetical protein SASPL_135339 [Salvia splendens]